MPLLQQSFTSNLGNTYTLVSGDDYQTNKQDLVCMSKIFNDPAVFHYITQGVLKKYFPDNPNTDQLAADFLESISKNWKNNKEHDFLVYNSHQELVGIVGYNIHPEKKTELWYYKLSSEPSFMSAAVTFVIQFQKQQGFVVSISNVDQDNLPSQKILEKNGFLQTGIQDKDGKKQILYELILN